MVNLVSVALVGTAIFSTIVLLVVAILAGHQYHEEAGPWLMGATLIAATWVGTASISFFVEAGTFAYGLEAAEWMFAAVLPVLWFGFVLVYTGRRYLIGRPIFSILVVIPAVSVGILLAGQVIELGLIRTSVTVIEVDGLYFSLAEIGPWGFVQIGYSMLLTAVSGLLLLVQGVNNRTTHQIQVSLLVGASFIPLGLGVVGAGFSVSYNISDLTPLTFGASGLLLFVAVTRFDVLRTIPVPTHLAHDAILESLETPLVVVNEANVIVHSSPEAEAVLADGGSLTGEAVTCLPGVDDHTEGDLVVQDIVEVTTTNGRQIFVIRNPDLNDAYGGHRGSILLYQDLTGIQTREQRLNVLNRVLRHDIRNEMTVVLGYATDGLDGTIPPREALEAISNTASEVVETSETAREIERLIDIAPRLEPDGSIEDAFESIHTRIIRDYPGASLETSTAVPASTTVPVGFREVLWHLVDNGIRHNEREDATVSIEIGAGEDGMLECTVSDDGPGIPASELTVFETGEVTALDHASGLGLWLVHWVVGEFGGSVHVESGDNGTSIIATIPTVEDEMSGS